MSGKRCLHGVLLGALVALVAVNLAACTPAADGVTGARVQPAEPAPPENPVTPPGEGDEDREPRADADSADPTPARPQKGFAMDWTQIQKLESEQKYEAAATGVEEILERARAAGEQENWTRALVRLVQLRTALHGYETAVRLFQDEAWPADDRWHTVLDLFYAHGLVNYLEAYSWEIRRREAVDTGGEVDLTRWTVDQIAAEAHRSFARAWERRAGWGEAGVGLLGEYLEPNGYPKRIRGTLRDTVTYLWVELLANSSLWRPEQSNRVYRLALEELLELDGAVGDGAADAESDDLHPLRRLAGLLADLESWHGAAGRSEAAFEARLERLRRLHGSFSRDEDREAIRADLTRRLEGLGNELEWWSMGQAQLAEMVRQDTAHDSLVRAREIALAGAERYPESVGGRRCAHLIASIEAPSYSLMSMRVDGPRRRSVEIRHRNLERLHLRAYSVDLLEHLAQSGDYNLLPGDNEIQKLMNGGEPIVEWSEELPPTPDYREHRTFLTPPLGEPGLYVLVASARPGFRRDGNHMVAVDFIVSDLVVTSRPEGRDLGVTVRSGATGRALEGVGVSLYRFDYQRGHQPVDSAVTGSRGDTGFRGLQTRQRYFVVARKGSDLVVDGTAVRPQEEQESRRRTQALVYTDRSIYRPLQEIHWKVVAYTGKELSYETLPTRDLTVELVDANGEAVAETAVTTNEFGSASGSFDIPAGRLLGRWRLRASIGGRAVVQVEEYKRPTFEVELLEPEKALRLNRPAELRGEARYYFGLPVVDGDVDWRVTREPVYPYWWSWYYTPRGSSVETVAAGTATLDAEGRFRIAFTPAADERDASSGVSYRYRLSAAVTEAGGETRSGDRAFTLGFVAVQATLAVEKGFYRSGETAGLDLTRTDLDGTPRPGVGSWRLTFLEQPELALLPAEQPEPTPPDADDRAFRTPGDDLRPRWQTGLDPRRVLRAWSDGAEVEHGEVIHDEAGRARLDLVGLAPGAYRLRYETEDDFGAAYETRTEFVVAGGAATPLALPAVLLTEAESVAVGGTARFLVHSGLADQELELTIFRFGVDAERRRLDSAAGLQVIEIPITSDLRGGFGVRLLAVRDHQLMNLQSAVYVPWNDRRLEVEFSTFRDKLRPGTRETWRVRVSSEDERALAVGSSELLAYMYDRSLDLFGPHRPPDPMGLYPSRVRHDPFHVNLGAAHPAWSRGRDFVSLPGYPSLSVDRLKFLDGYGIGGPGRHRMVARNMVMAEAAMPASPMATDAVAQETIGAVSDSPPELAGETFEAKAGGPPEGDAEQGSDGGDAIRADFSETAFWEPHLVLDEDGAVAFEFEVPDSVTEWSVWLHALTTDLRSGSLERRTKSVKELLVRPALPRFLREGDHAELRVVVNNAGEVDLEGDLEFRIEDPETGADLGPVFGLEPGAGRAFSVAVGGSTTLTFPVRVPARVGQVAFRVTARAGDYSDGELRPLPVLPGRMHLVQSRFATLSDRDRRELVFEDLAAGGDPTRIDDRLVVTLDTQLFYSVLHALPYLVEYPYECTEQTLNRFLSTGILSSLYDRYPAVSAMAKKFSERDTRLETWDGADANRKMALVETPWLVSARGGGDRSEDLVRVLDPKIARAERRASLAQLEKAQTSLGGFPWWPGGPPSPYMTLYILAGFSRALEFDVEVPRDLVVEAWSYMHRHYLDELSDRAIEKGCCWELVTALNYVLSSYPDDSWTGGVFSAAERRTMLDFSYEHWREHSPLLKAYLALTLKRAGRDEDSQLVFDSIMDSAKTTRDEGTFWAPEDRAWLWYNDRVETHAFALRALTELDPDDGRRHGLVQWLLLNKKLNHWKSTRATAEVIYALTHYLEREGTLGAREVVDVAVGAREERFVFEPDEYTGKNNQVVLVGEEIDPATSSTVVVEKETPGIAFASATWHFSTERLPEVASGDFFAVERSYFARVHDGREWKLRPLADGERLSVGDQVEVQLSIRSKHAAEYVHLRDPRPAGFEPESLTSAFKWDLGLGYYEEVRDSGANFFFEWLPVGEYTFKYRLRANVAGTFKTGPATLQSMYAPEFAAYSAGDELTISAD